MRQDKGTVAILIAALLPVVILASVVIADIAHIYYVKRQAQVMADAAAAAGVTAFEGWEHDEGTGDTYANINLEDGRDFMDMILFNEEISYKNIYNWDREEFEGVRSIGWVGDPPSSDDRTFDDIVEYVVAIEGRTYPQDVFSAAVEIEANTMLLGSIYSPAGHEDPSSFTILSIASVKAEMTPPDD